MATVTGTRRLLDISGNNISTAVSLEAEGTLLDSNGQSGTSNQVLISTATGVDWVDGSGSGIIGGPYLPVNNPTFTGALTGPSATITGNTLLGNSNGDYVHVNDRLFVGATDSGNAEFWFGEGATGDVNYGAHWHWDSGYTHKWFTVNNSSETLMMSYATNDTSKVNWYRDVDIQDNDILIDSSHGFINSGGWTRNTTPSGYIEFGPANTTWAHIYTDRPNFYFNKELYVNNQRVYNTGYHPEADKWTTARTLSLSGDASGSVSWDGSANATLSVTVVNNSHTHTNTTLDMHFGRETQNIDTYDPDSFWGTSKATGGSGTYPGNYYNIYNFAGNGTSEGTQLATYYGGNNRTYIRSRTDGTNSWLSWSQVWTSSTDGAGSGLDADLLDGQQGSYYLDYANFTGTPSIPSVGNGQIDGRTSGLGLSGSMDATANQSGNTTFTVTSNAATAANANTIAYRTSSADIRARLFRSNYQNQTTISGGMAFRVNNGADDYIRFCTDKAAIRTFLGVPASGDLNNYLLNNASDTLQKDQNADTSLTIRNNTNGTAASASLDLRVSGNNFDLTTHSDLFTGKLNVTEFKSTAGGSSFTFTPAGSTIMTMTGSFVEILGYLRMTGDIRGTGQQLVLNAGESYLYNTGQTNEHVYANAEGGLIVSSSPDNWSSGWAGRNTTYIGKADGTSSFSGQISVQGSNVIEIDQGYSYLNHLKLLSTFGSKLFSATNYGYVLEGSSTSANPVTFRFDNDRYRIYSGTSGEALTVLANGNVGIGTTNPAVKLHVGTATLGPAPDTNADVVSSGGISMFSNKRLSFDTAYYVHGNIKYNGSTGTAEAKLEYQGYYGHNFITRSSSKMVIKGDTGNVGIGTTSPADKLHVNGTVRSQAPASTDWGLASFNSSGNAQSGLWFSNGDGELLLRDDSSNLNVRLRSDASSYINGGSLGLGTTSPNLKLDVISGTNNGIRISATDTTSNWRDIDIRSYVSQAQANALPDGSAIYTTNPTSQTETAFSKFGGLVLQGRDDGNSSFAIRLGNGGGYATRMFMGATGATVFSNTVTATNFILSSDERLKGNVKKVCDNRVKADWKTFELKADKGQKRYGVIAQELEKTNPEFVREDSEGFKSVAYIDLLIAKIAELEARLEKLEK
jgi:hypothetical protein